MELKFRKKPVVIEAFQMTEERRTNNADWPNWLHEAWMLDREAPGSLYPTEEGTGDGRLSIGTLEGQHLVSWGDWIIQGVHGELYPCKPDIFAKTYEPAEASPASAPEGWKLVPVEPTEAMINAGMHNTLEVLRRENKRLRRMICAQRHGGLAYMDDGEASLAGMDFNDQLITCANRWTQLSKRGSRLARNALRLTCRPTLA